MSFAELVRRAGAALGRRPSAGSGSGGGGAREPKSGHERGMWPHVSEEQVDRMIESKNFSWDEAGSDFGYQPRPFAEESRSKLSCWGYPSAEGGADYIG